MTDDGSRSEHTAECFILEEATLQDFQEATNSSLTCTVETSLRLGMCGCVKTLAVSVSQSVSQ